MSRFEITLSTFVDGLLKPDAFLLYSYSEACGAHSSGMAVQPGNTHKLPINQLGGCQHKRPLVDDTQCILG